MHIVIAVRCIGAFRQANGIVDAVLIMSPNANRVIVFAQAHDGKKKTSGWFGSAQDSADDAASRARRGADRASDDVRNKVCCYLCKYRMRRCCWRCCISIVTCCILIDSSSRSDLWMLHDVVSTFFQYVLSRPRRARRMCEAGSTLAVVLLMMPPIMVAAMRKERATRLSITLTVLVTRPSITRCANTASSNCAD